MSKDVKPDNEQKLQGPLIFAESVIQENNPPDLEGRHDVSPESLADEPVQQEAIDPVGRKGGRWLKWWLLAVVGLGTVEIALLIVDLFARQDWMASLWLVLIASMMVVAGGALIREFSALRRLKHMSNQRQQGARLYNSPGIGEAPDYCRKIAEKLPQSIVKDWPVSVAEHHSDKEVMELFEKQVLSRADKQAMALISKESGVCSVMIAISPFVLADMAIVLWRNLTMLNKVSRIYGLPMGYMARVQLLRQMFRSMLYAGASELLTEAGTYALGSSLTAKLSTRSAQGLGAGILTARLGLKAMKQCRPVSWQALPEPGLSQISSGLIKQLKGLGNKAD